MTTHSITSVTMMLGFIVRVDDCLGAIYTRENHLETDVYDTFYGKDLNLSIDINHESEVLQIEILPQNLTEGSHSDYAAIGVKITDLQFPRIPSRGSEMYTEDDEMKIQYVTEIMGCAIKIIKEELERIKSINEDLYNLLKDRKIKLLTIPNN